MSALRLPQVSVERGSLDSPAGWALASLLGHVALAATLLLLSSRIRPAAPPPADPGFSVSLASLPPGGGRAGSAPAGPKAPKPTEEAPKVEPPPSPAPPRAAVPRESEPAPAPRPVPRTTPGRPQPPAPGGAVPDLPDPPDPGNASTGGTGEPAGSGGGAGTSGPAGPGVPGGQGDIRSLTSSDFPYVSYTLRLVNLLRSNWRRPHSPDGAVHSATIAFTILRDGRIEDVRIDLPSDFPGLDRSIERAVEDAAPFPPLPSGFEGSSLPARIVFELTPEE